MNTQPRKVLIVDDDISDIYLLNRMLRKCGVKDVESVGTAYDASKYMVGLSPFGGRRLPNLIFVDLKLAGTSGFHFISSIKGNPLYRNIPLVALSGSSDPADRVKAMESGANAYYEKTSGVNELQATVEGALSLEEPRGDPVLQR